MEVFSSILDILFQQLLEWFRAKTLVFMNDNYDNFYHIVLEEYPDDFYPLENLSIQELLDLNLCFNKNILLITSDNYSEVRKFFIKSQFLNNEEEFYKMVYNFLKTRIRELEDSRRKKLLCKAIREQDFHRIRKIIYNNKWIFLSVEKLFHLIVRLNFFRQQDSSTINSIFNDLKKIRSNNKFIKKRFPKNLEKELNNILSQIEKIKKINFTELQRKFVEYFIQNKYVFVHGYPGSSKTFTGMLAIILDSYFKLKETNHLNWLILAPTYEALLVSAENLVDFIRKLNREIFIDKRINIILPLSSNPKTKKFLENFMGNATEYEEENLRIYKLRRKEFNKHINQILNNGNLNIILDLPIAFIRYSLEEDKGDPKIIDNLIFHGLHIEEASQFSILDLLTVLIANKGQFLESLLSNSQNIKFSFSGDPYQLPSIFQIEDKIVKSKQVGPFLTYLVSF